MSLSFIVTHNCSQTKARLGTLNLNHATIDTPAFMPVGTQATVKSLSIDDLENIGYRLILSNTYHLMLRPGLDNIQALNGLHDFMSWPHAILTDSGGFQVYSLTELRKTSDQGIEFRSHLDGSKQFLSPEKAVALQEGFGVDIAMVLDECPPANAPKQQVQQAVERTTSWAQRCFNARKYPDRTAMFGIVQGGIYDDIRVAHAQKLRELDFNGFAIGGVSVGEAREDITRIVDLTAPLLPPQKPRYLMGVGRPEDITLAVAAGVDMFDCVMPTRNARNGYLFTLDGHISIKRSEYTLDRDPIDTQCNCFTCQHHTRAYLRHLFQCKELLYYRLASIHNLSFYYNHLQRIRNAIKAGDFQKMVKEAHLRLQNK